MYEKARIIAVIDVPIETFQPNTGTKTSILVLQKLHKEEIPEDYREVGQPVLIPGSMGTASYVLVGTNQSAESFHSVCHGAGRLMSRHAAIKQYPPSQVRENLNSKGIYVKTSGKEIISEEAPGAYKSIDDVIESVKGAGLAMPVVKMIPHGVVKG